MHERGTEFNHRGYLATKRGEDDLPAANTIRNVLFPTASFSDPPQAALYPVPILTPRGFFPDREDFMERKHCLSW
jgi:hypothetical protein